METDRSKWILPTGGLPPVRGNPFCTIRPILQVVNGVQMLKFDLGAAPSDFSPSPPGRKLRGTQRPGTLLKNGDFPQPVVASSNRVSGGVLFGQPLV